MLFRFAQIQTNEPKEIAFKVIPDVCKSLNSNLKHIDEENYYIYSKFEEPIERLFKWRVHILLRREYDDNMIDFYFEYEGVFSPGKEFMNTFLNEFEKAMNVRHVIVKKIIKSFHVPAKPDHVISYEIEKTEDDLIKIDAGKVKMKMVIGKMDSKEKTTLESVTELKYDVKPLGDYTNKITKKIKKLLILLGETNEMHLKKDDNYSPLFIIPYENIKEVEIIQYDKGLLYKEKPVLSITFHDVNYTTPGGNSISDLYEQNSGQTLILETKSDKDAKSIEAQFVDILEFKGDRKQQLRILSSLQGMHLCPNCYINPISLSFPWEQICQTCFTEKYDKKQQLRLLASLEGKDLCTNNGCINPISISFSFEQICQTCFIEKYGKIIQLIRNGEYHGGHKVYLAGGKFGECEYGNMILTDKYFIFQKIYNTRDEKKNWEIIIPFESVQIEQWGVQEGSRRNTVVGGAGGINNGYAIGSAFINESGKRHRLVIPYVDENGIKQAPIFGVSSLKGDLIRLLAANIYEMIVKSIKTNHDKESVSDLNKAILSDPLVVLKMRFAKGEISKEEFEDMKKLLE
jgi:hypothetical protein